PRQCWASVWMNSRDGADAFNYDENCHNPSSCCSFKTKQFGAFQIFPHLKLSLGPVAATTARWPGQRLFSGDGLRFPELPYGNFSLQPVVWFAALDRGAARAIL